MKLTRAWLWLVVLSCGSAVLVWSGANSGALAAAVLVLAWIKARIILANYLELASAPVWYRGFSFVLGLFMIGALALALAG